MSKSRGEETTYRFGDFELVPRDRLLMRDGQRIALTPRMFDLLLALVEADGHLVSKETLLDTVWSDAAVEEGNLNRTISALRKALGETRNEVKYIETLPKSGYRFVAAVETSNGLSDAKIADATFVTAPASRSLRSYRIVAVAFVVVGLVGIGALSYVTLRLRWRTARLCDASGLAGLTYN